MTIVLHRELDLSPYLFALNMDELIVHIQEEVPWCIFFTYDIILLDELRDDVNVKRERWQEALVVQRQNMWCIVSVSIYKELKLL